MYSFIILILILSYLIYYKKFQKINIQIFLNVFIITFISIIIYTSSVLNLFDNYFGNYVSTFSNDSYRYLDEVRKFSSNPLKVNEVSGSYIDYNRTPKFGMSATISIFYRILPIDNDYYIYLLMVLFSIFLSFICLIVLFDIFRFVSISNYAKYFIIALIFYFPIDYIWLFRFLREPLANQIFLITYITYLGYSIGLKKYYNIFIIMAIYLVIFRSQLLILIMFMIVPLILFYSLNLRNMIMFFMLSALAFSQSLTASGVHKLTIALEAFNLQNLIYNIRYINNLIQGNEILIFAYLFLSSYLFRKRVYKYNMKRFKKYCVLSAIIMSMIFVISIAIIENSQIRMAYPLFLSIKILIISILILHFYDRRLKSLSWIRI